MLRNNSVQGSPLSATVPPGKKRFQTGFGNIARKISRTRKPDDMSVEDWQIALRRQFGREQKFVLKRDQSRSDCPDFSITNPESGNTYRVAIRSVGGGDNYCSCPDFSTNTLLTCKHIEFTLASLSRSRKTARFLESGFRERHVSSVFVQYGLTQQIAFKPAQSLSEDLRQIVARYFDDQGFFRDKTFASWNSFSQTLKKISDPVRVYDDALVLSKNKMDQGILQKRVDEFFPRGTEDGRFGDLLSTGLYSYQREGALFAARNGRVLIADEMGLGKTIQAIAAVEILARAQGISRVLIVCPTSLKHQWKSEIEKFSVRGVVVIDGLTPKRQMLYAAPGFFKVINYDIVHRDLDLLNAWKPDLVILDEAQRIKNWKTRTAQKVKLLQSRFAIVLTGTPLENRLEELHSIVSFIDRQKLGPLFRFLYHHQVTDELGKVTGYRNLDEIGESLQPIMIRRKKDQVLQQLPQRVDKTFFLPMTKEQRQHHDENGDLVARIVAKWRRYGFLSNEDQKRLMIFLQNMRMSCNSTYLLDSKTDHGTKVPELVTILKEILEEPIAKVVVFSQWVRTHELIIRHLEKDKLPHIFFHGGVESRKRRILIDRFKEDGAYRIFLSTDAGGVGLNLQNASVVVNMDQPWNPAVLEQRIGRVHRLGQTQPVRVLNFVAEQTIEEGMLNLLKFKKSLFAGVLDGGEKEITFSGSRLKKFMETVDSITKVPENGCGAQTERPMETAPELPQLPPTSSPPPQPEPSKVAESLATAPSLNWEDLISTGMKLVEKIVSQMSQSNTVHGSSSAPAKSFIDKNWVKIDSVNNQMKLNIPIPNPQTLGKLGQILSLAKELVG